MKHLVNYQGVFGKSRLTAVANLEKQTFRVFALCRNRVDRRTDGRTDGRKDGKIVSAASGRPEKIPGVTYNGLSSHTGGVAVPLVTSFYGD